MARTKNFDQDTVLDRAVDIFRRQGYRGTTPAELVEHLGISRSSLYDTYGDKRSLFVLALKRYREQTTAGLNAVVENTTDALQSIKDLFALIIDGCLEDAMPKGCFLVNSLVEIAPDDQETKDIVTESMQDSKNAFRQLIEKAQQDGQISTTLKADAVAEYFVNCSSGISISIKAGVDRATCENIVKSSLAILGI